MAEKVTVRSTVVTLIKEVTSDLCNSDGVLKLGHFLKWLDACSCLSAERLSKRSCVTVIMDDLDFQSTEKNVEQGSIVYVKGKVTKVWGSSLEVNVVAHYRAGRRDIGPMIFFASVNFMYVAVKTKRERENNVRISLPKIEPKGFYEEYSFLGAEHRKVFRRSRNELIEKSVSGDDIAPPLKSLMVASSRMADTGSKIVDAKPGKEEASTEEESWELILPMHANHHGNTFGGEIMCWMANAAERVAWNYLRRSTSNASSSDGGGRLTISDAFRLLPVYIDQVHFMIASHVGDRLKLRARITHIFNTSMEISVQVFGASVDTIDSMKMINEGFLSFVMIKDGKPHPIPKKTFTSYKKDRRLACGRRRLRLKRAALSQMVSIFRCADLDGNGHLTRLELAKAVRSNKDLARAMKKIGIASSEGILKRFDEAFATQEVIDFYKFESFFSKALLEHQGV